MASKILQETSKLTIDEICEQCDLSSLKVQSYVEEGIVEVTGNDISNWRFSETMIVQLKKANRLEKDLNLNPAGVALALELTSIIDNLKNQLKHKNKK